MKNEEIDVCFEFFIGVFGFSFIGDFIGDFSVFVGDFVFSNLGTFFGELSVLVLFLDFSCLFVLSSAIFTNGSSTSITEESLSITIDSGSSDSSEVDFSWRRDFRFE